MFCKNINRWYSFYLFWYLCVHKEEAQACFCYLTPQRFCNDSTCLLTSCSGAREGAAGGLSSPARTPVRGGRPQLQPRALVFAPALLEEVLFPAELGGARGRFLPAASQPLEVPQRLCWLRDVSSARCLPGPRPHPAQCLRRRRLFARVHPSHHTLLPRGSSGRR